MDKSSICGVVLAGGFGSRLSPLTDSVPKPLMRILDKTVLSLILDKLNMCSIDNVSVSTHYMHRLICDGIKDYKNVRTVYEAVPLGTAGGAKKCMDEKKQNVIVLSGDGIFDFDLEEILEFHFNEKADVTIVSTHAQNPTQFGVIVKQNDGTVKELLEKPPWKNVVSDVVNTGIYVLSKRAMDEIPDNVFYDFSKDLFPKLIRCGYRVKTITTDGYWCDIGTLEQYLECNMDACKGKIKTLVNTGNVRDKLEKVGIQAKSDVFLGKNVTFGNNVVLENGFVSGNDCHIDHNCRISGSVLGNGVSIGNGSGVFGSVIGDGVKIGANCIIGEGCVIAEGCVIGEGTVLEKNTSVNQKQECTVNSFSQKSKGLFRDDGVVVVSGTNVLYDVEKLGFCLASVAKGKSRTEAFVGIICDGCTTEIKNAFVNGCTGGGTAVVEYDGADASLALFASVINPCTFTVCLSPTGGIQMDIYTSQGCRMGDEDERKLVKMYTDARTDEIMGESGAKERASHHESLEQSCKMYMSECVGYMIGSGTSLNTMLYFSNSDSVMKSCLEKICADFCFSDIPLSNRIKVTFTSDGFFIKSDGEAYDFNHAIAAVFNNAQYIGLKKGFLASGAPQAHRYILRNNGLEYVNDGECDTIVCGENLLQFLICRDRGFCILALLCIMAVRGKRLSEIMEELPRFSVYTDMYAGEKSRAASMERLCTLYGMGERSMSGVTVKLSQGNVTVIPDRIRGFKLISEAASMEAAKEICERIGKAVVSEKGEY